MTQCEAPTTIVAEDWSHELPSPPVAEPTTLRVLVVDDFAIERRIAGHLVKGVGGLTPIYAADGEEALRILAEQEPAAILTDMRMPGMNGLQLVERIRQQHPRVPVILMTAFGSEQLAIQALRAGASNYVPKRDLARDLPDTLKRLLELADADRHRRKMIGCLQSRTSRFELSNEPDLLPPLIDHLLEDLARVQFGDENTRIRMGVALQETLANALYHGNLEVSSELRQVDEREFYDLARQRRQQKPYLDRKVHITAVMDADSVRFEVSDQGPGFDTSLVNKPIEPEDLLRVGGRGLLLIRTFMDVVWHNPRGNQITLVKFAPNPQPRPD